tara:strand:+ start:2813 stop:3679 length:867 start_codon:yes stop_codon:yes gene_type:complete
MTFSKQYLFYDEIVKGAGIGHTLCCYVFGLEVANRLKLEYLPCNIMAGHGLSDVERFLGLEDFSEKRKSISKEFPQKIFHIKYQQNFPQGTIPISNWGPKYNKLIRESYQSRKLKHRSLLKQNAVNIAVSIRRGDVVFYPPEYANNFRDRLRPDQFYRDAINNIIDLHNVDKYFINVFSDGMKRSNYYVDENGKSVSKKELLQNLHEHSEIHLSDIKGNGDKPGSRNITFEHLQNCVEADIFIGSISGFSELINVLRNYKNCYGPSKNKNIGLIKWASEHPMNQPLDL